MHLTARTAPKPPAGLAFAIDELVMLRAWAERHSLTMSIKLDHVIEAAEFEELVFFGRPGARRPAMCAWRQAVGFVVQPEGRPPQSLEGIEAVLTLLSLQMPRRRSSVFRFWKPA